MTGTPFPTHDVLNQSPPFVDVELFALDLPLAEAVAANGGAGARQELSDFGRHRGSAAMAGRGRLTNENTAAAAALNAVSPGHAALFAFTRLAGNDGGMYGAVDLSNDDVRILLERALS